MFCAVMAILHDNIPCTQTVLILKNQIGSGSSDVKASVKVGSANRRDSVGGKSPAMIVAPKLIGSMRAAMSPAKKPS
jgi:hypothetical protein